MKNQRGLRPTVAEIDLAALRHNVQQLRAALPPGVQCMAMVKADAYGHGAVPISQALIDEGVESLGVATVEEGLELRASGIELPILVMGGLLGAGEAASRQMIGAGLTPVIHSADVIPLLEASAADKKNRTKVHLKIDTGMGRLGIRPEGLPRVLETLRACRCLELAGVMTHFAAADDEAYTAFQVEEFERCRSTVVAAFPQTILWHMANSAAVLRGWPVKLGAEGTWAVRPGLALYGGQGSLPLPQGMTLRPVMHLKSHIALLKTLPVGAKVSYGCTFTAARKTRLAVVPIGYADGYPRSLSSQGEALVGGRRVRVVGRVTMDMTMLDVTDIPCAIGAEVVLMGKQAGEVITVDDVAKRAGTIPYEIMCGVSKRMPRRYV